jgi:hypothetical protein
MPLKNFAPKKFKNCLWPTKKKGPMKAKKGGKGLIKFKMNTKGLKKFKKCLGTRGLRKPSSSTVYKTFILQ